MIPRIIHYCWFGNAPMPKSALKCIDSWRKYCPDYEIKLWNENNLDVSVNRYTKEAYSQKAWGFVSDYFRLWVVYNYGGVYLDTDVQMIKSFDGLLSYQAFAGMETLDYVALGLGFGAEPKNQLIKEHMDLYEDLKFINKDGTLNRLPIPHYTTEIMVKHGFQRGKNEIQNVDSFMVFPPEYFCPKDFATGITNVTKNTFSIHQFDASWYSEEEQEKKVKRWKKAKRERNKDLIIHAPNRLLRKLLGDETYNRLKVVIKRK